MVDSALIADGLVRVIDCLLVEKALDGQGLTGGSDNELTFCVNWVFDDPSLALDGGDVFKDVDRTTVIEVDAGVDVDNELFLSIFIQSWV